MNFKNFTTQKKVNASVLLKEEPTKKPKVVKKPVKRGQPSADYSMYPKVWQGCQKCSTESLHIISKQFQKIRCIDCGYTYKFEVTH